MRGMTRPEMMIQASDAIDHVRSLVDSEVLIVFYTCTGVILTSRATVVAVVPATFPPQLNIRFTALCVSAPQGEACQTDMPKDPQTVDRGGGSPPLKALPSGRE